MIQARRRKELLTKKEKLEQYAEKIHLAKLIISDIDGVVLVDRRISPGATQFFNRRSFIFLSNNSRFSINFLGSFFRKHGLNVENQQIFLAGIQSIDYLCSKNFKKSVALSANDEIREFAQKRGLHILKREDWSKAHKVVLCSDAELKFKEFEELINLAAKGVPFICANPDLTYPGDSRLYAETGCVLTALKSAVPEIRCEIIGKPETTMLELALKKHHIESREAVFIGDNPKTDGLCAQRAGMDFIHVGAGADIAPSTLFEHFA